MQVSGESLYISAKSGQKNGKNWFMLKFLDNDADEFFSAFVDENLFEQFQMLPKRTPVILTLSLVPGQKFFSVESLELLN